MNPEEKKKYSAFILTAAITVLCIIVVTALTWLARNHEETRWKDAFDAACRNITSEVQEELNIRVDKLIALRAFFQASKDVSKDEFETFVYTSETYAPDVYAVCWAPIVKKDKIGEFIENIKKYGHHNFNKKEQKKDRLYYIPILFVRPHSVQKQLLGLDILTRGNHIIEAIKLSYKTDRPATTNLILVPDVKKVGWMVFTVVKDDQTLSYNDSFSNVKGVLFTILYAKNITETALSNINSKGIDFTIYGCDKKSCKTDANIICHHDSRLKHLAVKDTPLFQLPQLQTQKKISICGHQYNISFKSVPAFFNAYASFESSAVLLCGIAISFLLILIVWTHTTRRFIVEKLVLKRTAELRDSRERLASAAEFLNNILDSVPHPILILDRNLKIVKKNKAVEYECNIEGDTSCCNIMQCFDAGESQSACMAQRVFDSGKTFEKEISKTVDAEKRNFKVVAAPFTAEDGKIKQVVITYIDITTEKKISERIFQARKLEALGQLAGGIAHDLNNVLQVINGYAEMATKKVNDNNPLKRHLDQIYKSGKKAAALTKSILAFSRKHPMQTEVIDLNSLVNDFKKMLERVITSNITMTFSPSKEKCIVEVDPNMIEQILMNLCVNAKDAMQSSGNGKLTIKIEKKLINDRVFLKSYDLRSGEYAVLSVADTGTGIKKSVLEKMFEPFFTTKPTGKGTGLGLSTVFGIVKQHKGAIFPESTINVGTTFYVYLPITAKKESGECLLDNSYNSISENACVLLAEDEADISEMNTVILKEAGYDVLTASTGQEALEIFNEKQEIIDMLVLDIIMPEMTGTELYRKIIQVDPTIPVLFVSGYAKDSTQFEILLKPQVAFLQKPFTSQDFIQKVNTLLNNKKNSEKNE